MSPLRKRMIEDMTLAGLALGTRQAYTQAVHRLAARYGTDVRESYTSHRSPNESADIVERDLAELGARLLVNVVDQMSEGEVPSELQDFIVLQLRAEDHTGRRADRLDPARDLHSQPGARPVYAWPHAYTYLQGKRLIVLKTRVETEAADAEPGTVVDASGEAIHVAAGHGG